MATRREVPYIKLGDSLKKARQKRQETIAEVSGAVEIEADVLQNIEAGIFRPSEDIMMLLISHFNLSEGEADRLWNLAGYETLEEPDFQDLQSPKTGAAVLPGDVRIVYTDTVHVVVNNFGVVMNFMQMGGPVGQPLMVSRVGMSKEHARSVLEVLKQTLEQSDRPTTPKLISAKPEKPITKPQNRSNDSSN
ncbi:MAG: helix-turn-helix transcriptional regulator [Patescibacteria group bacterium]